MLMWSFNCSHLLADISGVGDDVPSATSTQVTNDSRTNFSTKRKRTSSSDRIAALFNQPYTFGSEQHKKLTNGVAAYIFGEGLPIYTVEKTGFKKMLQAFDHR